MGETQDKPASSSLLRRLLPFLSLDWLLPLLDLIRTLGQWLPLHRPAGMYEILMYDTTVELLDAAGETAVFGKHQRARFLQDNVIAFEDYAWGDGEIFADYKVSPGVEVDRYQEGDRWNVLISLRETKRRGDVADFYIMRTARNGFTKPEEWVQTEIRHTTRHLKLRVVFPKERHCRRAILRQRSRNKDTVLDQEHIHALPDGRQMVVYEAWDIEPLEIYTLKWQW